MKKSGLSNLIIIPILILLCVSVVLVSGSSDTSGDTSGDASDASAQTDGGSLPPECTPGQFDPGDPCGSCGILRRDCDFAGFWGAWYCDEPPSCPVNCQPCGGSCSSSQRWCTGDSYGSGTCANFCTAHDRYSACVTAPVCNDGWCQPISPCYAAETDTSCPQDCDPTLNCLTTGQSCQCNCAGCGTIDFNCNCAGAPPANCCPNGACAGGEDCSTCPADCGGSCPSQTIYGRVFLDNTEKFGDTIFFNAWYNSAAQPPNSFTAPYTASGVPAGTYRIQRTGGGPSGAIFTGTTPSETQTLNSNDAITYNFNFRSPSGTLLLRGALNGNAISTGVTGSYSASGYFNVGPTGFTNLPVPQNPAAPANTFYNVANTGGGPTGTRPNGLSYIPSNQILNDMSTLMITFNYLCNALQGQSCGTCGTYDCYGICQGSGGVCTPGAIQCTGGTRRQTCNAGCTWQNSGTNLDGDSRDAECGDSLCDRSPWVYDSTRTATETICADGLDNDCDLSTDCADSNCAGLLGSGGIRCCQIASNCPSDDCVAESCVSNRCSNAPRPRCSNIECTPGFYCDAPGGNCMIPAVEICTDGSDNDCDGLIDCADPNCAGSAVEICTDGSDNDCDGLIDCADPNCVGSLGSGGIRCCQIASNCPSDDCAIESCVSNLCSNTARPICSATECPAGYYCDAAGGNCMAPDLSSSVCLNCVADATGGLPWTWTPSNHQDAGKSYSSALFNSDGAACSAASGGACYNTLNAAVSHKPASATGNCCGNAAGEFYKPDYYGEECTGDVNDCVWSTGDSQNSDTGNAKWWCFTHEWNNCIDTTIGTRVGGVTCAGIVGNNAWTPNPLPENQYSCTDGLDNDGDTLTDCNDTDCKGGIYGYVKNQAQDAIYPAKIDAFAGSSNAGTATTNAAGFYSLTLDCNSYNIAASHSDYYPKIVTGVNLPPATQIPLNFTLLIGTSCESDCTYVADNIVHAQCDDYAGCDFYDDRSKQVCDFSQPGWIRDYNATHYVVCGTGMPLPKIERKASVTCSSGTLVKMTRIVSYNGKPVKLVVAACG